MAIGPSGDDFQDLCTMIGLMTVQWAWAENALALTIGVIEENVGPIPGYPKAPLALSSRVDCLKRACRDISKIKSLEKEARSLAHTFVTLGTRRHDFIHGSMTELGNGKFSAFAVGVKNGKHTVKNHSFDKSTAVILNAQITKLVDETTAFMTKVFHLVT